MQFQFPHILVIIVIIVFALFIYTVSEEKPKPKPKPVPIIPKPSPIPEPEPSPDIIVEYFEIPKLNNRVREDSLYADIINRSDRPYLQYDRDTQAHETTHGINSRLRNETREKDNAFYLVQGNKAIRFLEPNIKKSIVAQYVPEDLRHNRFKTYVTGQTAWENEPLYLIDEWVCYINGAMVAVESVNNGKMHISTTQDLMKGQLEFAVYCTALYKAIQEHDPQYLEDNPQFKPFLQDLHNMAADTFYKGIKLPVFQGFRQEEYINELRNSGIAYILKQDFNGVWLNDK